MSAGDARVPIIALKWPLAEVRSRRFALSVLIVLAGLLRVVALGRESLWFDEAVSYLAANLPAQDILSNTVQSSHPPLYYLILHFWLGAVGESDATARLLSVIWDILLLPTTYLLSLELLGKPIQAFYVALAIAVSPFQILYSHELRMYTQLMFLVVLGSLAYLRAVRSNSRLWWIVYLSAHAAAVYTHLFGWLAFGATCLHAVIRHRRRHLATVILVGVVLAVVSVPWLAGVFSESEKELGSMRPLAQHTTFNPIKVLTGPAFLLFGMSSQPGPAGAALFLTVATGIIAVLEMRKAIFGGQASGLLLPTLITACVTGLPLLIYYARPYFLPERTMAAASPFLLIILAWGTLRKGTPLPYLAYASLGLMTLASLLYLSGGSVKPPYRTAMEQVQRAYQPGDTVLHTSDGSYLPALRYARLSRHILLAGDPDPRKPQSVYEALGGQVWTREQLENSGARLWVVVALEHSYEWQMEQVGYFSDRYMLASERNVGGIDVLLYDLSQPAGRVQ